MPDVPWESDEKRNYICMQNIITDVVSEGLREVFKDEWNTRYQASFGAWDDTSVSGLQLFHRENTRKRPNKNVYQAKFQHGDTNQWDCSVLFDAILYSNSIGKSRLNPTIKAEVGNIRNVRNKIMHADKTTLSDSDFQTMSIEVKKAFIALGLPVNDILQIEIKRNLYKSFQVLPSKPTHEVVYRSEKVNDIKQELQTLHINSGSKLTYFYISGNPESGKSQLSRQLCEDLFKRVISETEATFMMTLNAKDLDTIFCSYEDFCRRLNCCHNSLINVLNSCKPKDEKIKDLRSLIESRIKNWKRWWIIVDNVENLEKISLLLPQIGDEVWNNGQIILTIQNTTAVPSDSLFTKHISLSHDEVAEKISSAYPSTMSAAVSLAVENSAENSFILNHTFILFSLISFELLPVDIIVKYIQLIDQDSEKEEICLALKECSLLLTENEDCYVRLHRVVHEAIKLFSNCKETENKHYSPNCIANKRAKVDVANRNDKIKMIPHLKAFNTAVKKLFPEQDSLYSVSLGFEKLEIYAIYRLFGRTLYDYCEYQIAVEFHNTNLLIWRDSEKHHYRSRTFNDLGESYTKMGKFDQAKDYYQRALEIREKLLGPHHVNVADSYNNIGTVYDEKGDLDQAKDYYQRALEIKEKQLGPIHVDLAVSYNNIGTVYRRKGDLEKAKDYYQRALKIQEKQLGPNQVDVATSYNNIGIIYREKGELDKAKGYYQQALEIQEKQLRPNHADVARSYNNIGTVHHHKGDLDNAKDYYQRAVEIKEKQLGPHHIDVAASYYNIGMINIGDLDKAKYYYQRTLEIQEKQLGANHADVAHSLDNIGTVYHQKGNLDNAKHYYERALEIKKKQLGLNHVDVAASYYKIGILHDDKGDLAQAKDYYQRALEIQENQLGPNHVAVARSYNNIGAVYGRKGDLDQAKDYYQRALEIKEKQLGPNHLDVARSYNNIGTVHGRKGDLEQAKYYYHRTLQIQEKQLGANHVDVARSYNNIGGVYGRQGDLDKAMDYYQRALEIQEKQLGPNHVDVAHSYNNIGTVYGRKGDLDKAKVYYQRALEIHVKQLGPNHVDVAVSYNNIGTVYDGKGDLAQAKDYYQRALEIKKNN
ncbi:Nephrocystin-3 [Paramuricea clavata]|uniref:Nephrocystin-3 n=1 Tax=Paramuricea clavata TaxID=317549 RepID=A0A7D9ELM9_PARCT|nr:Nephrocystin-3 [Paramuricea clavata]